MFKTSALAGIGGFVETIALLTTYTYADLLLGRSVVHYAPPKRTYVIHEASETSALGLANRLDDVAHVFASIKEMVAWLYGQERQRPLDRSMNSLFSRFYMKEIFALHDHGGRKIACRRIAFTGRRWLGGFGGGQTWALWIVFHRLLPQWMRKGVWTAQRSFARQRPRQKRTNEAMLPDRYRSKDQCRSAGFGHHGTGLIAQGNAPPSKKTPLPIEDRFPPDAQAPLRLSREADRAFSSAD